jgi:purine-nucleoside phosphorylase
MNESSNMLEKIKETAHYIQDRIEVKPQIGIILGTGLGALADEVAVHKNFPYDELPNFPVSTVQSHQGQLVVGELGGKPIIAMQGRFHYYEGFSMQELTFPVRVMKMLGIQGLFISNACGSVNPDMKTGDMMIIEDHINLLPDSPLRGDNIDELGDRFPDMSEPYKKSWIQLAEQIAHEEGIPCKKGVYASIQGPNLETKAEYGWIRTIGADTIGMSTIPEVLVARHMHVPCFAISAITDEGFHEVLEKVTLEGVIAAANKIEPRMTQLMRSLITRLDLEDSE